MSYELEPIENYTLEPIQNYSLEPMEETENNGVWEGLIKPTAKALVKVPIHTITSMAQTPLSMIEAIPRWIDKGGNYLDVAEKVSQERQGKLDEAWLTTPAERKATENIGLGMKPFEWAGDITKGALTGKYLAKATGIPSLEIKDSILDPIGATVGQIGAMYLTGKIGVGKGLRNAKQAAEVKTNEVMAEHNAQAISEGKLPIDQSKSIVMGELKPRVVEGEIVEPTPTSQGITVEALETMVKGGKTGEPQFAGDTAINLSKMDTTLDVKNFADGLAQAAKIDKKTMTWDESVQAAEELGWDSQEMLRQAKRKGGFDSAEIYASRQIHANALNELFTTIRELPADVTKRTDAIRMDVLDKVNNTIQVMKAASEKASETGRSLNIFKKMISENPEFVTDKNKQIVFKKMFDSNGGKGLSDQMLTDLKNTDFSNPSAVREVIQKYHKSGWGEKFVEAWTAGILSAPPSQAANILGNLLTLVSKIPETAASGTMRGIAGRVKEFRTGEIVSVDTLPARELKAEITGMFQGTKEGVRAAIKAYQTGMPSDMTSKIETARYAAIPGKTGEYVRIPFKALTAADEFFKAVVYRSELNRQAYLKARGEGITQTDILAKRMSVITGDPVKNIEIFNRAHAEARYRTFQQPLGRFGESVMSLRDSFLPMRIIVPFIKTPIDIAKFTLERTPLNFGKILSDYKKGKISTDMLADELAKPIIGSLISAATVIAVFEGKITGGAPKDKKERELKYATGWQPYSLKIGDKYYSYARLEPIGSIIGMTADFVEAGKDMEDKEINEIAGNIAMSFSKNLSSKTFLSGVVKILDAASDPERYGGNYIEQLSGSVIPSGVAAMARSVDPYVRDVKTPLEAMKARTPFLSKDLPYKEGAYRQPIENTGGMLNLVSPIRISQESDFKDLAEKDLNLQKAYRIINKEKNKIKKEISRERRIGG